MALEAVVFQQDLFGNNNKELYNLLGGNWGYEYDDYGLDQKEAAGEVEKAVSFGFLENQTETFPHGDWNSSSSTPPLPSSMLHHFNDLMHQNKPAPQAITPPNGLNCTPANDQLPPAGRAKRRRSRSKKNKEEIENQRMTHIAVERNRRKQMNEYLSVLRSLMPESYVQRGDQASIIGGAINFVKELEQRLQLLGAHKQIKAKSDGDDPCSLLPFSDSFIFPQYSSESSSTGCDDSVPTNDAVGALIQSGSIADIEVTVVESHANLKIRSKKQPKQLLKLVSGLNSMRLTILHLNVSTVAQIVLYSFSVKIEDDCKLTSGDEIATAVYQLLGRIQEDAIFN